jgi:hypothetical protein
MCGRVDQVRPELWAPYKCRPDAIGRAASDGARIVLSVAVETWNKRGARHGLIKSYLGLVMVGGLLAGCASRSTARPDAGDPAAAAGASTDARPRSSGADGSSVSSNAAASAGTAGDANGSAGSRQVAGAAGLLGPAADGGGGAGGNAAVVAADGGGHGGHSGGAGTAANGGGGGGQGGVPALMPVYRIPLRVHTALSKLSHADLAPVFDELNRIWLQQGGVCFEIEVTTDETNRSDGFDFRYTAGTIPDAPSANGLTENAHSIWSIDHPNLGSAPHPVQNPTARTTAHELGHGLGLAHENPPPSTDCASPCYCAVDPNGPSCDDYLLRSGTKGYFLSAPEIAIARKNAANKALADQTAASCGAPTYLPGS